MMLLDLSVVTELRARTWAESVALRELVQLREWSPPTRRHDRTNPNGRVVVLAGERPPATHDWYVVESRGGALLVRRSHHIEPDQRIVRGPFAEAEAVASLPPLTRLPIGRPKKKRAA